MSTTVELLVAASAYTALKQTVSFFTMWPGLLAGIESDNVFAIREVRDDCRCAQRTHLIHISLLTARTSEGHLPFTWTHDDPDHSASSERSREVRMAPLSDLRAYGFSPTFCGLVAAGFPERGYKGDYCQFYGES